MRVIADTGGIVTALNAAEPDHERFRDVLELATQAFITPLVITEVHYILSSRGHHDTAADFLDDVTDGFYTLINPQVEDYGTGAELVRRYAGSMQRKRRKLGSLDLADAMNVVAAAQVDTHLLVASDQDYRAVRPMSGHSAFALLPADLENE